MTSGTAGPDPARATTWLSRGFECLLAETAAAEAAAAERHEPRPAFHFDVVIVGSGYGGAVALSRLAWFSNSVHISVRHMMRPMVLTSEEAAHAGIAARGKEDFLDNLRRIEAMLEGGPWLMGDQFTLCDGYAMVFFNWASFAGLDLSPLPALRRHAARMIERPAVAKVLTIEGSLDRIADAVG